MQEICCCDRSLDVDGIMSTGITGVLARLTLIVAEPSMILLTAALSRDVYQPTAVYFWVNFFSALLTNRRLRDQQLTWCNPD